MDLWPSGWCPRQSVIAITGRRTGWKKWVGNNCRPEWERGGKQVGITKKKVKVSFERQKTKRKKSF